MLRVRGIYDGKQVRLVEELPVPPDTEVEVLVPVDESDLEELYWQRLIESGLIRERRLPPTEERSFEPVPHTGEPVSQTIIDNRR